MQIWTDLLNCNDAQMQSRAELVASGWRRCILLLLFVASNNNFSKSDASGSLTSGFPLKTGKCNRSPDAWPGFSWLRTPGCVFLSSDQRWALLMSHCSQRENSFAYWLWLWRRHCVWKGFVSKRMASLRHLKRRRLKMGCGDETQGQYQTESSAHPTDHVWKNLRWNVCDLLVSVNKFDFHVRIHIDSLKKPVQVRTMRPWNMTHVRAHALDDHLYHNCIVLKEKQTSTITGLLSVWWNVINGFLSRSGGFFGLLLTRKINHPLLDWQLVLTSITTSHNAASSKPSQCPVDSW